ncbi:MAG: hypothetical protein RBS76_04525 [Acholeplasmatales bacterium]|nr:hypothetical protein [Acholeplasmataceae bacterium]MCK9427362.1 hypothetical protein [Acholeplasmataceae bacterium]MDD4090301.1 hypothetical protein [Acholeplasmataceae bacterium]MDY0115744.1 hypothetical protein [Acholeplasmatales bacterium]
MKTVNIIIRVFVVMASLAALVLLIFFGKGEGELIGSTVSVIISSIFIFLVTYLPKMLKRKKIIISTTLYSIILISFLLSMGGGFIFRFYIIFSYYDTTIHFLNGIAIVVIAFAVVKYLVKNSDNNLPAIIFVAVLISIAIGPIWEIYEFLVDSLFDGSNMQRFKDVHTGTSFIGQAALRDTMIDLIVDTLGAIVGGLILYYDSFKNKTIINNIAFKKENNHIK